MKRYLILGCIMLGGLLLRCYNLDFPSIGYHNMIENEHLSIAQEMNRTGDYLTRRLYFQNAFADEPVMDPRPQPSLVSYQIILAWKAFGENLWAPRFVNVVFGVMGIALAYAITVSIVHNVNLALFSAALLAFMPLGVFFSRNLQPESPALFFMLLGSFCYLKFISTFKKYFLFLGGVCFSIAWLYKFNFLIGVVPFLFCIPSAQIMRRKKQWLGYIIVIVMSYALILASILWLRHLGQWSWGTFKDIRPFEIFTQSYWNAYAGQLLWYIQGENYTLICNILAVLGITISFLKASTLLDRYILGWVVAALPYTMLYAEQLGQQNFSQMPFLILVCLAATNTLSFLQEALKKNLKKDISVYCMIALLVGASPLIYQSLLRMHGTLFVGVDVAGETLRNLTSQEERIFLLTHAQGYGILRYARRYGAWPKDLADFKNDEEKFTIKYICIYPADFLERLVQNSPDIYSYIQTKYHFKELGYDIEPGKPVYFIFERGQGQDFKKFLSSFSGRSQLRTIYRIFGRYFFFYSFSPVSEPAKGGGPNKT